MELQDFKAMWNTKQQQLEQQLEIHQEQLLAITLQNNKSNFEKYLNFAIVGRYLALVYCLISLGLIASMPYEFRYSIPSGLGALAMLFSFFQHSPLKKSNYRAMNLIELQKNITTFRIHTLKHAKYDKGIVLLWFLTTIPIYLNVFYDIALFSSISHILIFILTVTLIIVVTKILPLDIYKKWDKELREATEKLQEINHYQVGDLKR
ncbi:hypothetical protein [Aquimarina brevivitae]|uniref:Uncharacterized protein n=1 Tax=Aquimarina brevivitae TaxID=323412 RepID=A0A4V2F7K7_9FLAO|nr:hypothetical protein [Aquimarina brevivitae]RZT00160.1 hypothetical protein EV197_1393 [Aquimarina brevivitae]